MKKHLNHIFVLLLSVVLLSGSMVIFADPGPFENPDGATCTFLGNEEGDYGPVGVYWCEIPQSSCGCGGGGYFGYGPPALE